MRKIRYIDAINEAMIEEMERDENVFIIGEGVSRLGFGTPKEAIKMFGEKRVVDTPISEGAFTGLAAGAAMTGLRPVVVIMYIDFITCAMDQVINQIAKLSFMSGGQIEIPIVIKTQYGIGTREAAQHSQSLEAWFVHTPGLKVVMPSSAYDAKGLLKTSIRENSPVIFIENRLLYSRKEEVPDGEWLIPLGKASIKRVGRDITVVAISNAVPKVIEVAEELYPEIDVEVIDPRTLFPLDIETIVNSVKKTNRLLVVHESPLRCGIGAEIVRLVVEKSFDYLDAPPKVLGGLNIPIPFSPPLEDVCIPQKKDIVSAIKEILN